MLSELHHHVGTEAKLPADRSSWRTENDRVGVAGRLALGRRCWWG